MRWVVVDDRSMRYSLRQQGRAPSGDYRRNSAADLLQRLDLLGKYSYEKTLPQEVLRCSNRQLGLVVAAMFQGDGTVFKDRCGLSYTTTSRRLAEQLVLVLSRFGILSSLYASEDNREERYKTCYDVQVSGDSAVEFLRQIPLEGRKRRELQDTVAARTDGRRRSAGVPQQRIPNSLIEGVEDRDWETQQRCHR